MRFGALVTGAGGAEELLRLLMDNSGELIRLFDREGELVYVNQPVERLLGEVPTHFLDFPHAEDVEASRQWWERLLAGGTDSLTWRVRSKAGEWRWMESQGTLVPYRGTPHLLIVCRDVTERQRAEEAVRESERKLAEAQRIARLGYWELDHTTGHIDWSDEIYRIFGLPADHPLNLAEVRDRLHPEDRLRQVQVSADAIRGSGQYDVEYRVIRADGEVRFVHSQGTVSRDQSGQPIRAFGIAQDITELRRAEAALRLFRSLLDHSNDVIEVVDPDTGRFLDLNEQACRALGYSRDEYLALTVADIDPVVATRPWTEVSADVRLAGSRIFESWHRRKDGSVFPVEVNVCYVRLDRDYFLAVVRDISERKQVEAALRESADRLHHLSSRLLEIQEEERRHIARELHDEFGQLLATVTLHVHAAKSVAGEAARAHLHESMALLQRAGEQVRSLALELRPTMLETAGLEGTLRSLAEQHQQRTGIVTEVTGHLNGVSGELAIAGFRVVQEALTNVVRHAAARHVWIELCQSEKALALVVRDDGIGFDVDRTLGPAASRGGLGLLGMKERVQRFGGTLDVQSTPGRGTRIGATFPLPETATRPAGSGSDDHA